MTGTNTPKRPHIQRLACKAERTFYNVRRKIGSFKTVNGNPRARIGVYVAYFNASWIFEDHLCCIRDLSVEPLNYYVMGNCTSSTERAWFDATLDNFGFPIPFYPYPRLLPLSHGESLQRMIEATTDEIIVLCDVDAFPIQYGWDDYIVQQLAYKDVVAVIVDMPTRKMPVFLHPSFIAFRRNLLIDNRLDVLPTEGNDPAWRITEYLQSCGRLTPERVTPLFPTHRAIPIYPPGTNEFFGRRDLIHGFGTTYGDLVFHFWFGRCIASREEPLDKIGNTILSMSEMDRVVSETLSLIRDRCARAGK